MLRVVAAVIEREGKILIGQRPPGKSHPLEWEFPGGKVESGESLTSALVRELREELGIEAKIGREIARYKYSYNGKKPIELIFFAVRSLRGEIVNRSFSEIRWVRRQELPGIAFLEGDRPLIEMLSSGSA